jgi:hypothetical protein
MIRFIFTLDYEIYGNGSGTLKDLVWEPAEGIRAVFQRWKAPCVVFVEAAELEIIERHRADPFIQQVKEQVRALYNEGHEIGLHLHPQWYDARRVDGEWLLNYQEYNLCTLPQQRIQQIVDRSLSYLRSAVADAAFTPASFRAGNWLFQPTRAAAEVLAERGFCVDSSVFKGGVQRDKGLDYRSARKNGPYWKFSHDVTAEDPHGALLELPIFTRMVPFWNMLTSRRVGQQRKSAAAGRQGQGTGGRLRDYLRFSYPLKLDFCRMTLGEMRRMVDLAIKEDRKNTSAILPIVAIGHTKDLCDLEALDSLLSDLKTREIPVSRLDDVCSACSVPEGGSRHIPLTGGNRGRS